MKRDLLRERREWLLRRNCSLSPQQMGMAYALMCLFSFAVATGFVMIGMWQILLFTVLEMTAVAAAFLHFARHATDYEHIVLANGQLLVEKVSAGKMSVTQLELYFLRLQMPAHPSDLIHLESKGIAVDIGRFATDPRRRALAQELRAEVQGGLFSN
jgi:uncharacterized membrane protein